MEVGLEGQSGTVNRLEMKLVCFADACLGSRSHRGGENRSMSNKCDPWAALGARLRCE
jgi:hypothetical protein